MYYITVENSKAAKAEFTLEVAQDLSKVINDDEEDDNINGDKFYTTGTVEASDGDGPFIFFLILFIVVMILVLMVIAHFSRTGASEKSLLSKLCRGLSTLRRKLLSRMSSTR